MENMINKLNGFKMKGKKKGFTLIELLVVIIIIGILFVVLIPRLNFASDNAKMTGVKTDFHSMQLSLEQIVRTDSALPGTDTKTAVDKINTYSDIKFADSGKTTAAGEKVFTSDVKDPFAFNYTLVAQKLSSIVAGQPVADTVAVASGDIINISIDGAAAIPYTAAAAITDPKALATALTTAWTSVASDVSVNSDGHLVVTLKTPVAYGKTVAFTSSNATVLDQLGLKAAYTGDLQVEAPGTPAKALINFDAAAGNLNVHTTGLGKNLYE